MMLISMPHRRWASLGEPQIPCASAPTVSTTSPATTPANTDRRTITNAANPPTMAQSRMTSGTLASVPGGNRMILAMTPASTAIATARTHMNSSDSSAMPRAVTSRARARFHWAGSRPAPAAYRHEARSSERLAQAVDTVGERSGHDPGPEQIKSDLPRGHERPEHEPEHERQPVRHETAVARGGDQEGYGREEEEPRGQEWRQRGGEVVADQRSHLRRAHEAQAHAVREWDAGLARHLRQQPQRLDPHGHRGEMGGQNERAKRGFRPPDQRQQRDHHGKKTRAAHAHRQRSLDRRGAGAERRHQDHLRRSRPYQRGRGHSPPQAEAEIMRQRSDADIGPDHDIGQNRPPCGPKAGKRDGDRRALRQVGGGRRRHSSRTCPTARSRAQSRFGQTCSAVPSPLMIAT